VTGSGGEREDLPVSTPIPDPAQPSDRDRFAHDVLVELLRRDVGTAGYVPEEFAISYQVPGGGSSMMYLNSLYAECQQDPDTRVERIDRFVSVFLSISDGTPDWEHAQALLRPVLRWPTYSQRTAKGSLFRRPSLPFLDEMVVVDLPASMRYVSVRTAEEWAVSEEEVFGAARAAMRRHAIWPGGPVDEPGWMRFVEDGDAYWVSHLLVDGWLAALAPRVGGRPIAFVPDVNTLIVAADQPDELEPLFEHVLDAYTEAPRSLSPCAYTVGDGGRVESYRAPAGHPLSKAVRRAECRLAVDGYSSQRDAIEAPEFVAACMSAERPDRPAFTFATWADGTPTLLPRTDVLALSVGDDPPVFVPFEAALAEGVMTEAVEYHPVRYRTVPALAPRALERLRDRQVSV
jgi:hypothetical protein